MKDAKELDAYIDKRLQDYMAHHVEKDRDKLAINMSLIMLLASFHSDKMLRMRIADLCKIDKHVAGESRKIVNTVIRYALRLLFSYGHYTHDEKVMDLADKMVDSQIELEEHWFKK